MVEKNKSLLSIALKNTRKTIAEKDNSMKKEIGQFFTPENISKFMASMSFEYKGSIKILDPGAGTGLLSAALLDEIITKKNCSSIDIVLFETDESIIKYLIELMNSAASKFLEHNIDFSYEVHNKDFILFHEDLINVDNRGYYDIVISNPPYFKVPKNHKYSLILTDYIYGQPNVYFMFMIISIKLLRTNGQLIFLTPRSYCSGNYFKKFRSFLLENIDPVQFHLFNTRKKVFTEERITQELVIINGIKRLVQSPSVKVSSSGPNPFNGYSEEVFSNEVLYLKRKNEMLIRLPLNRTQEKIIKKFDEWSNNIGNMEVGISTGPVVPFRCKEVIEVYDRKRNYPLFYMKNIKNGKLQLPLTNKDLGIRRSSRSIKILVPSKNYLFIKRFSSSEQKKRIECCYYVKNKYDFTFLGIENHLNYLYKNSDEDWSLEEMYGLNLFLNSKTVDSYFRIVNGNTQVNAFDITLLPLPSERVLKRIGRWYISNRQ